MLTWRKPLHFLKLIFMPALHSSLKEYKETPES